MTKTISKEELESCRRVPLHYILGLGNPMRKAKIKCPFHSERTASCTLFPTGGYHCFGCGSHGNSVDFLLKAGGSFDEAIESLKTYSR